MAGVNIKAPLYVESQTIVPLRKSIVVKGMKVNEFKESSESESYPSSEGKFGPTVPVNSVLIGMK